MIGCGLDWLEGLSSLEPEALFLTYGRERGVRAAIADDRLEVLLV